MITALPDGLSVLSNISVTCLVYRLRRSFGEVLISFADPEGRIVLSVFDSSYYDMAYNLYETSFRAFNINNYMFIGADHNACKLLEGVYHGRLCESHDSSTLVFTRTLPKNV